MSKLLFTPYTSKQLSLANRTVMAPMTRSRATQDNIPVDIMVEYYRQRAEAGLIVTEGTSPSPNGVGYSSIPGIYNQQQIRGWQAVTRAVHDRGGKIFVQLMHTGRIGHEFNLPVGASVYGPSAVAAAGQIYSVKGGMVDHPVPQAFTTAGVKDTIQEFVQGARNAIDAGFDGVELHGANGYLIEQFLNPTSNIRTDEYGGSIENRSRFLLEIASQIVAAIGPEKVGVRFSPYGLFNDMAPYNEVDETYDYLSKELEKLGIAYIHLLDHSAGNNNPDVNRVKEIIRKNFSNTLIFCGGFTAEKAEETLQSGAADLIAFGVPFLANPDLVERMKVGSALNSPDPSTFYAPGEKGYTDYPTIATIS